jgi:hypothetical protein
MPAGICGHVMGSCLARLPNTKNHALFAQWISQTKPNFRGLTSWSNWFDQRWFLKAGPGF